LRTEPGDILWFPQQLDVGMVRHGAGDHVDDLEGLGRQLVAPTRERERVHHLERPRDRRDHDQACDQEPAAGHDQIVPQIAAVNQDGIIVVATNPVDILTYISAEIVGLDQTRVLGSGTILDTARLRYLLGQHYRINSRSVHAYVVGEHGDSELPLWSLANIGGVPLQDFVGANGQGYNQAALDQIFGHTKNAAYEIIERKKATYYAIGLGLQSVVEAIVRDQHTVLTVSSPLSGQYGVSDISISMPTIVGRRGVEKVLDLPLSEAELEAFQSSAQTLKERISRL